MASNGKKSVLFVCLGNICRSPIAEAVFRHLVQQRKLESNWVIDSAATSTYEIGNNPDRRGQKLMKTKGITMAHKAKQVTQDDFRTYDFIFGMDESNIGNLKRVQPSGSKAKVMLLGSYDPEKVKIIEDPYYGSERDFETVYQQCLRCCTAFLDEQS